MAEQTLTETLGGLTPAANSYHSNPPICNTSIREEDNVTSVNQRIKSYENDTYEINHGLSVDEVRVLFRILAKEYEDCGRKRGAILRYIKAYQKPKENLGQALYHKLRKL